MKAMKKGLLLALVFSCIWMLCSCSGSNGKNREYGMWMKINGEDHFFEQCSASPNHWVGIERNREDKTMPQLSFSASKSTFGTWTKVEKPEGTELTIGSTDFYFTYNKDIWALFFGDGVYTEFATSEESEWTFEITKTNGNIIEGTLKGKFGSRKQSRINPITIDGTFVLTTNNKDIEDTEAFGLYSRMWGGGSTTGGSSGGSDGSSSTSSAKKQQKDCLVCNYSGKCHICNGKKRVYVEDMFGGRGSYKTCDFCGGTGLCNNCGGDGIRHN